MSTNASHARMHYRLGRGGRLSACGLRVADSERITALAAAVTTTRLPSAAPSVSHDPGALLRIQCREI